MFIARQLKSYQPLLLLAIIAVTTFTVDRGVCRAQTVSASARTLPPRVQQEKQLITDGLTAFERGDNASARDSFQRALGLNPDEVTAHTYLGIIADRVGDLKEAERHFSAAAKAEPQRASARNNYGAILMRTGRPTLAAAEFEASLKLDRDQPNALVNLAQIRFADGTSADLRASAELFKRAFAIKPDVEVARALTVISLRLQDYPAASAHHRNYAERLDVESGTAAHAPAARAELGAALLEAGLLKEAESELTAAVKIDPADQESIVRLARVYLAGKDLKAAGRTLEAAVARGVKAAPVYALLAEVYEQSSHLENAIPAMRLAIAQDPQSEKYRFAYGILLTNAYAPAAAVIRLEQALRTFPDSSRLWFALGLAHFKQNKNDEAARALLRAMELDPKFAAPIAYLGVTHVAVGQYTEGVALYEKALRIDPQLAVVHYLIADALLKQTESDRARIESHLRRAIEMDAAFAPARLALAKVFVRAERWAEAVAELEKIIKLDPNLAEAYYQLGRAYVRLKRPAEAQSALASFKLLSETQKEQSQNEQREIVRRLANVRF